MKCAVLGFGNPVRGDDAIGCVIIENLKKEFPENEKLSFFDMGTNGFEILFALKGHTKIIVVDAVNGEPKQLGEIYKVPADELLKAPENDPMLFLHGMKWNQGLSYAKKIMGDEYPKDINAFLISITNTSIIEKMNPEVMLSGDKVVEIIKNEILEWLN